jgi:2-dehydro-3-deoxygalactonokinase
VVEATWLGIDWGGTHRRAWRYDGESLVARHDDSAGLLSVAPRFAASLPVLLAGLGLPAGAPATLVMAGMVGSAQGWQEAPYLDASRSLLELPQRLVRLTAPGAPDNAWIVPGVRWQGMGDAVDVMRGEETQLLGALHLLGGGAHANGWYVLPGTHCKWVWLEGGRIRWLRTYLTGELFALLGERGTLAPLMQHGRDQHDTQAFSRGVTHAAEAAMSHALFGARARVVTGALPREAAASYVSGVLIGTEWHDLRRQPGLAADAPVRVIGAPRLAALHAACAAQLGHQVELLDVQAVQAAAWQALRKEMPR